MASNEWATTGRSGTFHRKGERRLRKDRERREQNERYVSILAEIARVGEKPELVATRAYFERVREKDRHATI